MSETLPPDHPISRLVRSGETVRVHIPAPSPIVVTDERIAVAEADRIALDIEIAMLRRIQFDIERDRPATLVIVPEHAAHPPQVPSIPPEHFQAVGDALTYIGHRLYGLGSGGTSKSD